MSRSCYNFTTLSSDFVGYEWRGEQLVHVTDGTNEMHIYYDAQNRPAMADFNGTYYAYLHNLQGDVVGLVDSGNNLVVEYKYDAWGRPTLKRSLTTAYDALATLNPFRYRGYIYDEASGLYYLRSRFYNPVWGRFINADEVTDYFIYNRVDNCYAYCNCCPIMYIDENGLAGSIFPLGNGWFFRIETHGSGDGFQKHIHVWKEGGPKYAQNADGSPHDGLRGNPPKWVRQKLKDMKKWNWKVSEPKNAPPLTPRPSPSASPSPYPSPAPQPASLPDPTTENQRQISYYASENWKVAVAAVSIIAATIWGIAKIVAAPYTGGLSLALP